MRRSATSLAPTLANLALAPQQLAPLLPLVFLHLGPPLALHAVSVPLDLAALCYLALQGLRICAMSTDLGWCVPLVYRSRYEPISVLTWCVLPDTLLHILHGSLFARSG